MPSIPTQGSNTAKGYSPYESTKSDASAGSQPRSVITEDYQLSVSVKEPKEAWACRFLTLMRVEFRNEREYKDL